MINYHRPGVEELKEIKRDRLLWIKKSLLNAIARLPGNRFNNDRVRSIEEIDRKLSK